MARNLPSELAGPVHLVPHPRSLVELACNTGEAVVYYVDGRLRVGRPGAMEFHSSGRGTTRAEDDQGTPTQSHISPSILVYEDKQDRVTLSGEEGREVKTSSDHISSS